MKAVAKLKAGPGAQMIDAPLPKLTSHRVLVKVKATSVCGSDVHLWRWDDWAQRNFQPPRIFGHECAGEVVEVGNQVEHIRPGDRVSLESHIPCMGCPRCKQGQMHLCNHLEILGFHRDGCFAEYVAMPEICCVRINPQMPWEIATLQEPLGNAVYAVSESDVAGKQVVVFGDGPQGLFAVACAKAFGAAQIFAVGASPTRMEIMKMLKPDWILKSDETDVVSFVKEKTLGDGVDVVLEMSGAEKAIHEGLAVLHNGGTFTAFGIPSSSIELNLADEVIMKGVKINAIFGRKMFETWQEMARLLDSHRLDIRPIITHRMRLDEFLQAMELLTSDPVKAGKIILYP